jgi:hypothetical protein
MQTFLLGLRYFFIDLIGGVMRWPFWWYTQGLLFVVHGAGAWVKMYSKSLAVGVWVKNIFVPMFGAYDWQSRIISFFMRVFQIVVRSFALVLLSIVMLGVVVGYVLLLPLVAILTLYHVGGLIPLIVV